MREAGMARSARLVWNRLVLWACLAAAVANALLIASAYVRLRTEQSLSVQVEALRENLAALSQLQASRRSQLESQLAEAEGRVETAEAALPSVETALDVFRLGFELAEDAGVVVLSVRRDSSEVRETAIGPVEVTTHRVSASGTLAACMTYLGSLEALGPGLGVSGVSIQPEPGQCSMDVLTLGRTP
jgi:hypothetical protein